MHRLIAAYAAELRTRPLAAAQLAAGYLEALADQQVEASPGGYVPEHLEGALAADGAHPLAALFARIAHGVPWVRSSAFRMPTSIAGRYCYCEIVGPTAPVQASEIKFGAYLQYPDCWYPFHSHSAEELYFPISGTALWSRDGIRDEPAPPGTLIRHASLERHATRTGPAPMLALWTWLGNLDGSTYLIDDE